MKEEWRPVVGYEGLYEVSNLGNVKVSLTNPSKKSHFIGKKLTLTKTATNYRQVCLTKNGIERFPTVHRLVAFAFIPNPDNKPHINHIDNDRSNNVVTNIEWCTNDENVAYKMAQERHVHGERVNTCKITEAQAKRIKQLIERGERTCVIAKKIGCSYGIVYGIRSKSSWKHLDRQVKR